MTHGRHREWGIDGGNPDDYDRFVSMPLWRGPIRPTIRLRLSVSGLVKCFDWQAGLEEMTRAGLHPAWAFRLAALVTEICSSVSILLKRRLWLGARAHWVSLR